MRIRTTVAAVSGALALSAFVVPAAQATYEPKPAPDRAAALAAQVPADEIDGDTRITKVVVNGGKALSLGTTAKKTITAEVTATDPEGIYEIHSFLWNGAGEDIDNAVGFFGPTSPTGTCTEVSATTSKCKYSIVIDPALMENKTAGTWKLWVSAIGADGDSHTDSVAGTTKILRASTLSANASPEPVVQGKPITVTGKLARANWDTDVYAGYTAQPVKLQFRKAGTSTYSTVKTVNTNSTGNLKTTVTAASDGYWRWAFAGTSTTAPVTATGDYVDVR
ncbi:calcium-binding protein [Streptomyces spiramyceticus]|uniref:calcium-binding protein n=1 Tax=Streptomyces spiramyceticus TaxID=299717 RepID=UPI00237B3240|nr:calcium-binding protein [Streptomyces spiramyceticus]